jgi:hypothetical protein
MISVGLLDDVIEGFQSIHCTEKYLANSGKSLLHLIATSAYLASNST